MRIAGYLDPEIHEKKVGANALIELFTRIGFVANEGSKTKGYYCVSSDFRDDLQKRKSNNYSQDTNIFISNKLIDDLEEIHHKRFDTARLVKYCREINDNFKKENYFSVIFLCRAVLDHCPPIFNLPNFESLGDQLPKMSSLKKACIRLRSLQGVADFNIHKQIESKEVLPVIEEIDFKSDMNFLIGRIIDRLSKNDDGN